MKSIQGFIKFIREQGVMGLAIGFILGGSVSQVVNSLVTDIINPLVGILLGKVGDFTNLKLELLGSTLMIGAFLSTVTNFIIIAAVVYYIFKGLGLDKIDHKDQK